MSFLASGILFLVFLFVGFMLSGMWALLSAFLVILFRLARSVRCLPVLFSIPILPAPPVPPPRPAGSASLPRRYTSLAPPLPLLHIGTTEVEKC
jgi:hypothetical protein